MRLLKITSIVLVLFLFGNACNSQQKRFCKCVDLMKEYSEIESKEERIRMDLSWDLRKESPSTRDSMISKKMQEKYPEEFAKSVELRNKISKCDEAFKDLGYTETKRLYNQCVN